MDHFVVLKNEQTARLVLRDTALYVHLGSILAVYAAEGQAADNAHLVQVIRTCSVGLAAIMFSIYLSNDYYVSKIGRFIASNAGDAFKAWEDFHRRGWLYYFQKALRVAVVVLLFAGWTLFQGTQAYSSGDALARAVTIVCMLVVAAEFLVFVCVELGLGPKPTTTSTSTEKT